MSTVSPSGPKVLPPDCETAQAALMRQYQWHRENAAAVWHSPEFRAREADRATDLFQALITLFPEI